MGQRVLPVHQILALKKGLDTRLLCATWREEAVSLLGAVIISMIHKQFGWLHGHQ